MFRNILDSTQVAIDPKVTCLVGKNESGKSAFLTALWWLNPARTKKKFSVAENYPAWLEKRHRNEGRDQESLSPIDAVFEWEESDVNVVEEKFGPGVAKAGAILILEKRYNNEFRWTHGCDEKRALKNFTDSNKMPAGASAAKDFKTLVSLLAEKKEEKKEDQEASKKIADVQSALNTLLGKSSFDGLLWEIAQRRIPKFLYFADYSKLPYSVKIDRVLKGDDLTEEETTARALLQLGGTENEYMLNPDYERRKRELENVANALSEDVKKYWTQNPELRVTPDITQRTEQRGNGNAAVLDELKIRIWDNRHSLSLPFTEHSAGFQWFFSFLAAFSEYEFGDPPVVILLDEPAVGLHAKAQSDFLRFIEERLSKRCQVIYTTHSPFMIQPGQLERVRLVEDVGPEKGSTVSGNVLSRDRDTLFPLQGALGYDLVQHLFVAEHNLVVEGTSDYAYLKIISDFLKAAGRAHLNPQWSIVPVGGADLIPTFVALLGNHLKVTVVVDSRKGGQQRLHQMAKDGYLEKQRLILLGEILGQPGADIEDFFQEDEYLALYNKAFSKKLKEADVKGSDPITQRIARHEGVARYDHGGPADVLLRDRDAVLKSLSEETLKKFEKLFDHINKTMGT
jgi:predicted ATP-dependent endonuclease of OLD family